MLPVLLTVGPVKIYAYGLFLFLSLFFGLFWWWRVGKDENLDEVKLFDAFFLSLVWFLVGARLANWWWGSGRGLSWWQNLALLSYPGLVDWVGVVLALVSLVIFARKQGWQVMRVLDMAVEVLSFILVGANLGGFLNGSNPGKEVVKWGVRYVGSASKVIPVDLWGVVWFGITLWLVAKVRREFRFYEWYKGKRGVARDGLSLMVFVIMTGIYYGGSYWLDDRGSWQVGLALVLAGLGGVYYLSGKKLDLVRLKQWKKKWRRGKRLKKAKH